MARHNTISEHASGFQYFCALFVCIGSLLWGYDSGIFGTAQAQDYFQEKFNPSPAILGAIVSTYTAGGAVGCLLSWPIGNRFGRIGTLKIGAVVAIIGTTLQTAAQNVGMLIVGRSIAGLAIGIIYFAISQYQSEIAPAEHRGSIVGLHAQFIGFGYAISNWIGFGVYFGKGQFTYAFPVGLQILWAVLLLAGTFFLPETPRFLILKGQQEAALGVLRRLRSTKDESYLQAEFKQMVEQITWDEQMEIKSAFSIIKKPSYARRLILACGVQIGQQICGVSAINYYQTIMYKSLGIKGSLVLALAGVWGLVGPLANIFCLVFIIDRIRRRTMLIAGSLAMAVDIALVMMIVAVYGGGPNSVANGFGVFFLLMFSVIFSLSWNSGAPVYCTELFPTPIRATGGAIATFWSFIIQVILAQASPVALDQVGWRYYIFFIVTCLTCALCVYMFLPETLGKTLEEINEVFGDITVTEPLQDDQTQKIAEKEEPSVAVHSELV